MVSFSICQVLLTISPSLKQTFQYLLDMSHWISHLCAIINFVLARNFWKQKKLNTQIEVASDAKCITKETIFSSSFPSIFVGIYHGICKFQEIEISILSGDGIIREQNRILLLNVTRVYG
jgi:hypothetical protein